MTFIFGAGIASAQVGLDPGLDQRFQRVWDTIHGVDVGDFVIFNTDRRKAALKVTDITSEDPREIEVTGSGGGVYLIRAKTNRNDTPSLNTDKGENADDLRMANDEEIHDYLEQTGEAEGRPDELVGGGDEEDLAGESSAEDTTPGVEAGETDIDAPDRADFEVGDDVGHPVPSAEEQHPETEPENIDDHLAELTGNAFVTYDDLLTELNRHPDLDSEGFFFARESPGWTFVDELLAFGQDVPKSVNNWELVDYGIVENADERKLVWVNRENEELVALAAHRPNGGILWHVYHADEPMEMEDEEIAPESTTDDPFAALDMTVDMLYGDDRNVDVELVQREDGDIEVVNTVERRTLGTRVLRAVGLDRTLPSLPGEEQVFSALGSAVEFVDENKETVGRVTLFAVEFAVVGVLKRIFGVRFQPVIEQDELGVKVQYRYDGKEAEWVDGGFGAKLTIDPQRFDLRQRSGERGTIWNALEYEQLAQAAEALGVNGVSLALVDEDGSSTVRTTSVSNSETSREMRGRFLSESERGDIVSAGDQAAAAALSERDDPDDQQQWLRNDLVSGAAGRYIETERDFNVDRTVSFARNRWDDIDEDVDDFGTGDFTLDGVIGDRSGFHVDVKAAVAEQTGVPADDWPGGLGDQEDEPAPDDGGSVDLDPEDLDTPGDDLPAEKKREIRRRADDLGLYGELTDAEQSAIRTELDAEFGTGAGGLARELGPPMGNRDAMPADVDDEQNAEDLYAEFWGAETASEENEDFMRSMLGPEERDEFF